MRPVSLKNEPEVTYSGLVKSLVVSDGFRPPAELIHDELHASPINRSDVGDDVRGINSSLDLIRRTRGGGWPTGPVSEADNFVDIVWHELEHREGYSYTYVVRDSRGEYVGCCYLYPVGRRAPLTAELVENDVDVSWWVTERAYEEGLYAMLYEALRLWVARHFPFSNPYFSNVEIPDGS